MKKIIVIFFIGLFIGQLNGQVVFKSTKAIMSIDTLKTNADTIVFQNKQTGNKAKVRVLNGSLQVPNIITYTDTFATKKALRDSTNALKNSIASIIDPVDGFLDWVADSNTFLLYPSVQSNIFTFYKSSNRLSTRAPILIENETSNTALTIKSYNYPGLFVDCNSIYGAGNISSYSTHSNLPGFSIYSERANALQVSTKYGLNNMTIGGGDETGDSITFPHVGGLKIYEDGILSFNYNENLLDIRNNDSVRFKIIPDSILLGNIEKGDYVSIDNTGSLKYNGNATAWEDDNLDPTTLTGGGSAPSSVNWASTNILVANFQNATTDEVQGAREIPHRCKLGSQITFHVHWAATTTNTDTIRYGLEYFFARENVAVTTTTTIYTHQAAPGVTWAKKTANFLPITIPNALGSQFHFRFFRDGTNVRDSFTGNAAVSTIGYHYEIDAVGSRAITTK